ncbi:MAG: 50S ribosomal protein L11 methyltransferase [Anaerolineae bacterium]|jgi:ribosomal protein L11 methyltransferase|nr:50S ribosomal protein L11 methyltransferase [Anaerolineae bacterium]
MTTTTATPMEWLEVSVLVNHEAAEAVAEVLSRYAPQGVALDLGADGELSSTVTVKAYLAVDAHIDARRRRVEEGLWHLHQIWPVIPEPTFRSVADQDWTAAWKEQIQVLHLARRIVIKPTWRTYEATPDEAVLELDPGLAFGTGLHPTTQLCVAAIEDYVQPGAPVLDLGTGTGILAMVAARLGAGRVMAVDNDENAVIAARANIQLNGLASTIDLALGSLSDVDGAYDLVVANILAPVIIAMAGAGLADRVSREGTLVVSGILEEQIDGVVEALHQGGLNVIERRIQEEWAALVARHESPARV